MLAAHAGTVVAHAGRRGLVRHLASAAGSRCDMTQSIQAGFAGNLATMAAMEG